MKTDSIYLVKLTADQPPVFPDRCAACASLDSDKLTSIQVSDENGRVDFYCYNILNQPAQGTYLKIPIHESCARNIRNAFFMRLVFIILVATGFITLGFYLNHVLTSFFTGLLIAVPLLYVQFKKPVPMEFYYYGKMYYLMFSNPEYAREVARKNNTTEVKHDYPVSGIPAAP